MMYEVERPARVRDTTALKAVAEMSMMSARKRLIRPVVAIAWRGKSERGLTCAESMTSYDRDTGPTLIRDEPWKEIWKTGALHRAQKPRSVGMQKL